MNSTKWTVKSLAEVFWAVEKNNNLFQWKVGNVSIWPVVRMVLFYKYSEKIELYEKAHPLPKGLIEKFKTLARYTWGFLFKNPLLSISKKSRYVLVPHRRKINGVDVYSEQIAEEIKSDLTVLEFSTDKHSNGQVFEVGFYYVLAVYLSKIIRVFVGRGLFKNDKNFQLVAEYFNEKLQVSPELTKKVIQENYITFLILRFFFRLILKRIKPEILFMVVGYFRLPLIAAAQDLNIKVVELQHGTITKYHLGYSFPGSPNVPYYPNMFLGFGQYWKDTVEMPSNMSFEVIGAPYVEKLSGISAEKKENCLLFCSQGVIGRELFQFAYETARLLPDAKVIFRLHPSEYLEEYERKRQELPLLDNFELSHKNPNIFLLLKQCEYQVGVFSTTIFEGIVLGAKPLLVNMSGIEYMDFLISKGVPVFNSPEELTVRYREKIDAPEANYFYANPAPSILSLIENRLPS